MDGKSFLIGTGVINIMAKTDQFSNSVKKLIGDIKNNGLGVQAGVAIAGQIGKGMSVAGAGIVGGLSALSTTAQNFNRGLNKVGTIADTNVVPLNKFRKEILSLSNDTGVAVGDISNTLYEAISANNDTANSMDYVTIATKAAKGGFTDSATAIDGLTTVMNAYNLKGKAAMQEISDEMLVAQNLGKTTFGEMAQSMGNVIPIASTLNVSTKELFASVATLTSYGIKTDEAVTALKGAYTSILSQSAEASKMAKQLGIDFSESHLKAVGWTKFLDEIKDKTHGNTTQMASLFGNVRALNGMLVLTGKGNDKLKEFEKGMNNAGGATESAFKKMQQGESLTRTLNLLKNIGIEIGNIVLPKVNAWLEKVQAVLKKFDGMSDSQKKNITDLVFNLGKVLLTGGLILNGASKLIGIVGTIKKITTAIKGVNTALKIIPFLTGPVGLAITGIALGAGLIIKYWKPISGFFKNLFMGIKNTFKKHGEYILAIMLPIPTLIIKNWSKIKSGASKILNSVKNEAKSMIKTVRTDFANAGWGQKIVWTLNPFTYLIDKVIKKNIEAIKSGWKSFVDLVDNLKEKVLSPFKAIAQWIQNIADKWNSFKNNFSLPQINIPLVGKVGGSENSSGSNKNVTINQKNTISSNYGFSAFNNKLMRAINRG
ncbi:phage tail tape measure protein [Clostridium sp. JN-9]|uniref:phage tail tape measure protein n=1 Tax=Clostridium sp. JN-9 TaxID=2507159 RepID=UPI0013E8B411|nr:phage tail tape measure protein [Clostridium sp. JN-9]